MYKKRIQTNKNKYKISNNIYNINEKKKMERCTLDKNGFEATYYPGTLSPEKAIISVSGATCDEKMCTYMCRYLRKSGYNILVLGFYVWKGLHKDLVQIPVDYAEKAVKWLKEEKKIKGIAMTGTSTGAAYTLLAASFIPDIECVIPVVPYDYVPAGTVKEGHSYKAAHKSQYTWHGEDLPYTPIDILDENGMLTWLNTARKTPGYGLRRFMRFGYDEMDKRQLPEARIKVENMHADVLFLAVKNDDRWPSDVAVPRMVKILKEANYPYRVESHIYEKGSHFLFDGIDEAKTSFKLKIKFFAPAETKYPKECNEARQDSFKRILKFIDEWQI